MRHLYKVNETHKLMKTAPSFGKIHYLCDMKDIIETMPRIELTLIIIGVFVLIGTCLVIGDRFLFLR